MKKLTIISKSAANKILVDSLFRPVNGQTLNKERYDMGKYKAEKSFIGRELNTSDNVVCIWQESRRDKDGPYKALYCLVQGN